MNIVKSGMACMLSGLLLAPHLLNACDVVVFPRDMPRTFKIIAYDEHGPMSGLEVVIERSFQPPEDEQEELPDEQEVVLRGLTNPDGAFQVDNLAPGQYDVSVGAETEFGWHTPVLIKDQNVLRLPRTLYVSWVPDETVRLQKFEGVMTYKIPGGLKPLTNAAIVIKDARTGQVLREAKTSVDGSFSVGRLSAGFYSVVVTAQVEYPAPAHVPATVAKVLFTRTQSGKLALEISRESDAIDDRVEVVWPFTCTEGASVKVLAAN